MGCDIHLYVERKNANGEWEPIKGRNPWYDYYSKYKHSVPDDIPKEVYEDWIWEGRHYSLFAVLANVRNYDMISPISHPKGLPKDVSDIVEDASHEWGCDGHSHSYVTLKEILQYCVKNKSLPQFGVIPLKSYEEYTKTGTIPKDSCLGICGPYIEIISPEEADDILSGMIRRHNWIGYYVPLTWFESFMDIDELFFTRTIPEMMKLGEPENVRLIFWFDN